MINIQTTVAPIEEPVTLLEMYDLLRLDPLGSPLTHPHDEMLRNMISASRVWAENYTRRSFVQQGLRLVLPRFPKFRVLMGRNSWGDEDDYESRSSSIELPKPPFLSIEEVAYFDESNVLQIVDPATYFVSAMAMVPALRLNGDLDWPDTCRREDAVRISYTTGYPPAGSPADDYSANVPAPIKQAIRFGTQLQYDDLSEETRTAMEAERISLLGSYRVYTL